MLAKRGFTIMELNWGGAEITPQEPCSYLCTGEIIPYKNGFHIYENIHDCYPIYEMMGKKCTIAEVALTNEHHEIGIGTTLGKEYVTSKVSITKILSKNELEVTFKGTQKQSFAQKIINSLLHKLSKLITYVEV